MAAPGDLLAGVRARIAAYGGTRGALGAVAAVIRREGWRGMLGKLTRGAQQQGQYARWIAEHDSPSADEMARFARLVRNLPRTPLISVVVPAYNTPASCLTEMIESVLAQVYPHWELCIANDASTAPHVREILDTYAQRDVRVRVHHRQQNGHICAASNSALELATGEFVALLDHDDLLAPQALAMVIKYLNDHPHARLFYSDEDKVSSDGRRITPYFKAGWDPELILQRNVFSHLGVYETALVREVGGFRVGFEGSQDHDLVLRCVRVAGDAAVVHIPHVLYHWRAIDGSTAVRVGEKPYAVDAGVRAVREALAASTPQAEALEPTLQRPFVQVRYPLPEPAPTVQALVRCSGRDTLPEALLRAIFARTPGLLAHVTLVGSDAAAMVLRAQALAGARRADIVFDAQPGLAAALSASKAACVCLLDAHIDTFDEGWLEALVRHAMRPEIGLVGPRLGRAAGAWFQAGLVAAAGNCALAARSGATREDFGYFGVNQLTRSVTALPLDCVVARRAVLADVAALVDTQDAGAELRLARALSERGLRHVVVAGTIVQSGKAGQEAATVDQFVESALLDRAYSPHLELAVRAATFEIAVTPRIGQFD